MRILLAEGFQTFTKAKNTVGICIAFGNTFYILRSPPTRLWHLRTSLRATFRNVRDVTSARPFILLRG